MISDEAVEAAAKVMYAQDSQQRDMGDFSLGVYEHDAKAILEAAAPYMLAKAYNAGHLDGMTGAPNNNPYRS